MKNNKTTTTLIVLLTIMITSGISLGLAISSGVRIHYYELVELFVPVYLLSLVLSIITLIIHLIRK